MKSMIAHIIDEEIFNSQYIAESGSEFIERICAHIYSEVKYLKKFTPTEFNDDILKEIESQVKEVFKIKTYGYSSLYHCRKVHWPKTSRVR